MPVPDARVELQIDGTWTNVIDHVVQSTGIQLSYGRSDEGRPVDPGSGSLTLLSPDGLYSNRNPNSDYFGKLPRNTPIRITAGGSTPALLMPEGVAGRATTPDHASLDITGDLDIRVDLQPALWQDAGSGFEVIGKYVVAGNQRSYRLMVTGEGQLLLTWSPDGVSVLEHRSPVLPVVQHRQTVRATLDVNNGLGGYTLTYYTAPSLAGPWTQVGQTVTTSGITQIFASTAPLEVGDLPALVFTDHERRIYAAEVRNGIGGSVVAAPSFQTQQVGTTGFVDSAGRSWTVVGGASISDRVTLAAHVVPTWPSTWHRSGHDVRAPIETAGILWRLGLGRKALASTLRRRVPSYSPLAYWPCEDGASATQAASPITGVSPLVFKKASFGQDDSLPGSAALPTVEAGGSMTAAVPVPAAGATEWTVTTFYKVDSQPGSEVEFLSWRTNGSLKRWRMLMGGGGGRLQAFDFEGTLLIDQGVSLGPEYFSGWWRIAVRVQESGPNINWQMAWFNVGGQITAFGGTSVNSAGAVTQVNTLFGSISGLRVGHVTVLPTGDADEAVYPFLGADDGWAGESAVARLRRLADEEAQTLTLAAWQGDPSRTSALMGAQRPGALQDTLQECADSDGGILTEDTHRMGLVYRDRTSLENQTPTVIPYAALTTPFEPTESDTRLRNDVTVQRVGGSSARAVQDDGPLSVAAVGLYDEDLSLSLYQDTQAAQLAYWRLYLGTWDEARYPTVRIMLHAHPELIPTVSALQVGDRVQITGTPSWMPPGPVDLIVQRITHNLRTFEWTVDLTCSPGGPWLVGVAGDAVRGRADTAGSELAAGVSTTDTSLSVTTTAARRWTTDPADFPFDIQVGGEEMTATAITGTGMTQTMAVTRSVNGIVKAHSAGADVRLAHPTIAAL
ncbi:hypothetical protein ACFQ6B_23830 [Streptomyces wedmorensis]|uniref:Uncharacterized protein n=1 Tax=Streptomyces wedmorensis TaxID=43759 RepID=A0ABW6J8A1_STRWE